MCYYYSTYTIEITTGSLDHLVKGDISMETKIKYLSGIAKGIYHLHKNNIIHRDLAARNILVSTSYNVVF